MSAILEILINGVMLGALYALFGLGLSLSLGVMRMINIAHGDLIVFGAYLASIAMSALGVSALASTCVVLPAMFVVGWLIQTVVLNRVAGENPLAPLLVTFGLSIVLQNALLQTFTADTRSLPSGNFALLGLHVSDISVGVLPLLITLISVAVYASTHQLVSRTHWGRQARSVADDPATARLVGVDDKKFFGLVAGFITAVVGLASILYGIRTPFSPSTGPELLLFAFEAVVLGGLGSLWGTFLGGLVIGLAQLIGAQFSSGLGPFWGHIVFMIVLIARPQGLFGKSNG